MRGTPGDIEQLNPEFRVRPVKERNSFFKPGRVFKVYWPEPKGQNAPKTTLTEGETGVVTGNFGEEFFAKIRWFVVIRAGDQGFCTCLTIQTYGNRGVSKPGTTKCYHSVIYTGQTAPKPKKNEEPNVAAGERPMLASIRVRPKRKTDKMDVMSRLNYSKMYTVEHNVKVYDFGTVHEKYLHTLKKQFEWAWHLEPESSDEEEGEEEEGDDDDDDQRIPEPQAESRDRRGSSSKGKEREPSKGGEKEKRKRRK